MARRIVETILTTPDILNRIEEALGDRDIHSENRCPQCFKLTVTPEILNAFAHTMHKF